VEAAVVTGDPLPVAAAEVGTDETAGVWLPAAAVPSSLLGALVGAFIAGSEGFLVGGVIGGSAGVFAVKLLLHRARELANMRR
jgi:hypothetical protein